MFVRTFALLHRSLRVDDRLLRTHLFRLLFVAIIYFFLVSTQQTRVMFSAPGLRFFQQICYLNFVCITLGALSYFSTVITEEKEEMTLGLLRMAGISPLSLLLGKSIPRLMTAALLLSAQFPFTLLAITLGGVALSQVIAAYVTLLAYLVLAANLGFLFSVISLRSRSASVRTGLVLGAYFLGPFLVRWALIGLVQRGWLSGDGGVFNTTLGICSWLETTSAFHRMSQVLATGAGLSIWSYQAISNLIAGAALFTLSWIVFDPATRNEKPAMEARGVLTKRLRLTSALAPGRAWNSALAWKDFYFTAGGVTMLLMKFVLYGAILGIIIYTVNGSRNISWRRQDIGGPTMGLMLFIAAVEVSIYVARTFYSEIKWKTLSSIVLLPKTVAELAYPKLLGCFLGLIPVTTYFFIGFLIWPEGFGEALEELIEEPGAWLFLASYCLFLHLVSLLSLYVKWGALPLAFALIYVMGPMCLTTVFIRGPDEGLLAVAAMASFIACGIMQVFIAQRLRELAAQ